MTISKTDKTNQLLILRGGKVVEGVDKYFRYHDATKRYLEVDVVQLVDIAGFRFIIHKVQAESRYYMATEIATGESFSGSTIDVDGLIKRLEVSVPKMADLMLDNLKTKTLSPRYTEDVVELAKGLTSFIN